MKIDTLRKKHASAIEKSKERNEQIRAKEKALSDLRVKQDAAALAGDLELFEQLAEKIRRAENELIVYTKSTRVETVTPEDGMEAWKDYASKTGAEILRLKREYETARGELARKYEAAVLKQNELLRTREELAGLTGAPASAYVLPGMLEDAGEAYPRNHQMKSPEFAFFAASGEWRCRDGIQDYPALDTINAVVRNRVPVDNPRFN